MWILLAILILMILLYAVVIYNRLVSLRNRAQNAWADIHVQLKRRHDLIPNLVETVKGYASHEKSVFEDVARLRSHAMELDDLAQRSGAETQLSGAIKTLFLVSESYPELRADKIFRDLQAQLVEVENNIQSARCYYNAVVRDLNIMREAFPSNIISALFNFGRLPYFQITEEAQKPVQTSFI